MMTVSALRTSAQAQHYYAETDDYYSESGAAPSAWQGQLASELGLTGEVDGDQFRRLLDGQMPSGEQLGRWAKDENGNTVWQHRPGYDATLSAPKSVSVMALVAGDDRITAAHDAAVSEALAKLEQRTTTRIRSSADGEVTSEQTGSFAAATFRHETSRNQDAQLHTHAVILNATRSADGQLRSLESREFYRAQSELSEHYQQALGSKLRELGYDVERVQRANGTASVEIAGVPQELIELHSSRRRDIEAALAEQGIDPSQASGTARQAAALDSRKAKEATDHHALRASWQEHARAAGHDLDSIVTSVQERAQSDEHAASLANERQQAASSAVETARQILAERESVFSADALRQRATREAMATAATATDIDRAIENARTDGQLVARQLDGRRAFTTPEAIHTERRMLAIERDGREAAKPMQKNKHIDRAILATEKESGHSFNAGQRAATAGILAGTDRIQAVQGYAGTAKTTSVLRTVAQNAQQREVVGLAPTASAAAQLAEGAGIENSGTVAAYLNRERGAEKRSNDSRLVIVDEASMLSARDMANLLKSAERNGDRVVLVGDVQQLGSVEAGRAFSQLQEHGMTTHVLADIVRQRSDDLRAGVESVIQHDAAQAMRHIERSGEIVEQRTADDRRERIAADYLALSSDERERAIVIDPSRDGRKELNEMIRAGLREQGELGAEEIRAPLREKKDLAAEEKKSVHSYETGDQVEFARDYQRAGLEAGRTYTVAGRDGGKVQLVDDAGNQREFDAARVSPRRIEVYRETEAGLSAGDQIAFTRNDRERELANGTRGVVESIDTDKREAVIVTDAGKRISLDLDDHNNRHLRHAYAETAHAAQGQTADRVYAHAESQRENLINSRSFYVAISRAKDSAHVYTDDRAALTRAIQERTGEQSAALDQTPEEKARQQWREQLRERQHGQEQSHGLER